MALTKRVEVLFDPAQYTLLEQIAKTRRETVGALVRRAVEHQYLEPSMQERKAALEGLLSERTDITWEEARKILDSDVGRRF